MWMVVSGIYLYEARRNFEYGAGRTASGGAKDLWRNLELLLQSVQPPAPEVRVASVSDIDSLVAAPVLIAELHINTGKMAQTVDLPEWLSTGMSNPPRILSKSAGKESCVIKRGVMELPKLTIDHFMALFLSNCLAYESCHKSSSKHFTAYIVLLDCLVKSEDEICYLCNNDIIENYIGTDAELASFINILGKNVSVDVDQC